MNNQFTLQIEKFFKHYKIIKLEKGEIFINAGENPQGVYFLKKGLIKEYSISTKGNEFVLNIFKPGAFFPMAWAMNSTPNNYYFETLEDSELWRAPKEDVIQFLKENPSITFDLLGRVFRGTDGLLARISLLMSGEATQRLILELIIVAKRFGKLDLSTNSIEVDISEKDLANNSGMARETVSREINKLKEKRLIQFNHKKLVIPNLQLLENEL